MVNGGAGYKTKVILADSLRTLLKRKPLDKIKIREIVDECGLNRQTFYYHFQDLYDLVEWMYIYDGEQIVGKSFDGQNIKSISLALLSYFEHHREEILSVLNSKARIYFSNFLEEGVRKCCDIIIDNYTQDVVISKEYKDFLSLYYTNAVIGAVLFWIKTSDSNRIAPSKVLKMFEITTTGTLEMALNNYKNEE